MEVLVAILAGSAGCNGDGDDSWEVSASVESPEFMVPGDSTSAGHFTLTTRNAPSHSTLLEFTLSLEHEGACCSPYRLAIIPDSLPDPWHLGGVRQFPCTWRYLVTRESEVRSCPGECIDGFAIEMECASDTASGTSVVQWSVGAHAMGESGSADGVEVELVYDP